MRLEPAGSDHVVEFAGAVPIQLGELAGEHRFEVQASAVMASSAMY